MKHQQNDLTNVLHRPVETAARSGRSAQTKTAPEGATIDYLLCIYAFLRLATPTKPKRPDPNSHNAAGTGTGDITSRTK